jgi:HEAT repeat protein
LLLLAAGCGGGPEVRLAPEATGDYTVPLDAEQHKQLAAAERMYREGDPAFAHRRDAMAGDPVLACWLTRMLVRDAVLAFDRRQASDEEFLRQAVGSDPLWDRARAHLQALGGAAAPCLIEDLLRHPRHDRRRLGVTLLGITGEGSLPPMKDVLASPDAAMRRLAVLAVGEMPPTPGTAEALRRAAGDREFTVRAAAYEGLGRAGPAVAHELRAALGAESDSHVRRVIARALGSDPSKASAQALLAYMRRSLDGGDRQGFTAAHEALARLAGVDPRRPRGYEAWASWTAAQPERWEVEHGALEDRSR